MNNHGNDSVGMVPHSGGHLNGAPITSLQDQNQYITALSEILGHTPGDQRSLLDYVRGIFKRKLIVALITTLGVLLSILYLQHTVPSYVSESKIEIEKVPHSTTKVGDLFAAFGQFDLYYRTQLEALKSRDVAAEFLKRREKEQTKVKSVPDDVSQDKSGPHTHVKVQGDSAVSERQQRLEAERLKAGRIGGVLGRVSVAPVRGTRLISVHMSGSDPLETQDALKSYLDAFISVSNQKRSQIKDKVRSWIAAELAETSKQLKHSKSELLAFTKKHGVVFADKNPNTIATTSFDSATKSLLESKSKRFSLEALAHKQESQLPGPISSETLDNLEKKLAELKSEYADMKAIYSPNYFKMTLMREKIQSMEDSISGIKKQSLSSALEAAENEVKASEKLFEKTKKAAVESNSLAVQYDILKKAFEANAQLYLMLLQRSKEAQLDNGMMGNNIIINSAPTLPLAPISPKKDRILLTGIVLGLLSGLMLALVLEFMDDTVQSSESIQQRLKLPILGAIPRIDQDRSWKTVQANGTAYEFVAHKFPTSPLADAVRIVQNTVASHMQAQTGSVIAMSSALPVEGKTFMCVLMASVIASENKKVLIIDGDMRKPRVHEVFGGTNEGPGLSELLEGKQSVMDEVIQSTVIPGLYYIKAGTIPENPVALVKDPRMRDLVETCRAAFDYVLLDGPPLLGVADARILAGYADGLILVTRAGHTSLEMLRQAKESILSLDGRLLGVVLNMADPKSESYKHYYYSPRYYKNYYHQNYQDEKKG